MDMRFRSIIRSITKKMVIIYSNGTTNGQAAATRWLSDDYVCVFTCSLSPLYHKVLVNVYVYHVVTQENFAADRNINMNKFHSITITVRNVHMCSLGHLTSKPTKSNKIRAINKYFRQLRKQLQVQVLYNTLGNPECFTETFERTIYIPRGRYEKVTNSN